MNLLLRILHLKNKPTNNTCNRTTQLSPRKILPNTSTLPMQESNLRKIRTRASILVRHTLPRLGVRINPALRQEILAILAPE
jgi:hypothetical protein